MNERGQGFLLYAIALIGVIALGSLFVDGGLLLSHAQRLQDDLDVACVYAADFGYDTFDYALAMNHHDSIISSSIALGEKNTYVATAYAEHTPLLSQFMNINSMDVYAETRCLRPTAYLTPVAVQEPWVIDSYENGTEYPILGQGADAESQPGNDFPGAVITQIWCVDGAPCESVLLFDPIETEHFVSCQPYKDVASDTLAREIQAVYVPEGTHVPHVAGVSNNQLVRTAVEAAGWEIGDTIFVMVFDGNIYQSTTGNCDNLRVDYYTKAIITSMDNNTVRAILSDEVLTLEEAVGRSRSRTVQQDY